MDSEKREDAYPHSVVRLVGMLHLITLRECDKIFRQQNFVLEMDQIPVILMLCYNAGWSQKEICNKLQRDKASVNRTISIMSKKGLARVVQDANDRRKTRIELTALGKEVAKQADDVIKQVNTMMTTVLTEKELQQFSSLIKKLIDTSFT